MTRKIITRKTVAQYPLMTGQQDRLLIWQKARGMWKHRKPDPMKELEQVRKGWDREMPTLQ